MRPGWTTGRRSGCGPPGWTPSWPRRARRQGPTSAAGEVATVRRLPPPGSTADRTHAIEIAGLDDHGRRAGPGLDPARQDGRERPPAPLRADRAGRRRRHLGEDPVRRRGLAAASRPCWPVARRSRPGSCSTTPIRDAVRDAELDPGFALELVCAAVAAEPADVVVAAMLRFAREVLAGRYADPVDRTARTATVNATARAILLRRCARLGPAAGRLPRDRAPAVPTPRESCQPGWPEWTCRQASPSTRSSAGRSPNG